MFAYYKGISNQCKSPKVSDGPAVLLTDAKNLEVRGMAGHKEWSIWLDKVQLVSFLSIVNVLIR